LVVDEELLAELSVPTCLMVAAGAILVRGAVWVIAACVLLVAASAAADATSCVQRTTAQIGMSW
jgi:hypothetical protein